MPSPPPGPAELCVGDCSVDFRTQSEQLYSFVVRCSVSLCLPAPAHPAWAASSSHPSTFLLPQTPTFDRVSPSRGPASGGTRLTISGSSLNAGSRVTVTVRDGECQFVRCCRIPPASACAWGRGAEAGSPGAHLLQVPFLPTRRDAEAIVCVSPGSTLGPSQAPITLAIDRANISSPGVIYTYTQDPTVTRLEPTWSIIK